MRDGQRVAIVLLSAIGDVVNAFPLVSSLKAEFPHSRLDWITQPVPGEIVRRHPGVGRVWKLDRRHGWKAFRDLRRKLSGERFDLALDLQVYLKASLVTSFINSPRKIGFDRARARELNWMVTNERLPARPPQNVREEYLEFADHLGARRRYEWPIALTGEERKAQSRFLERVGAPLAAFVVGTTRREKEWAAGRWAELADVLHYEWGYGICLLGGSSAAEDELARRVIGHAVCPIADLRADDIGRLLWLLDSVALLVACDTGPYHLGVGMGVPSVGLFGATDPARYGPTRRHLELLVDGYHDHGESRHPPQRRRRSGRMSRIAVVDVLAKVELARERHPRCLGRVRPGGSRSTGQPTAEEILRATIPTSGAFPR